MAKKRTRAFYKKNLAGQSLEKILSVSLPVVFLREHKSSHSLLLFFAEFTGKTLTE